MRVKRVSPGDLPAIAGQEWVDPARRAVVMGGVAYVPVKEGEPCELEIPERRLYRGRGYQLLGDVVLLHGHRPTLEEAAEIEGWLHPRGILWVRGVAGAKRIPLVEVISGTPGEVCHHEFGCRFTLDPARVMYAMGNLSERHRLAGLAGKAGTERIGDLFAGIGYFTIPLAREGCRVHAMEISPVAFGYLARNVRDNGVAGLVEAECGDCRHLLKGTYDRLILGHFDAPLYLADALAHARTGTVLHVHTLHDEADRISSLAREAGFTASVTTRRVKSYAPHVMHRVQDVALS
ncbi:MAG TPA: SAM-dependent methyltransferase [Methanomicrobiales archaeon]|nr:SAM-dependent methyltransferase [Methanomicrobiales archaeon]